MGKHYSKLAKGERNTIEWLAYTDHNDWYNKGAYAPGYASLIIYAPTRKSAVKQAKDLFGRWGHVEFRQNTKVRKVMV